LVGLRDLFGQRDLFGPPEFFSALGQEHLPCGVTGDRDDRRDGGNRERAVDVRIRFAAWRAITSLVPDGAAQTGGVDHQDD